MPLPSATAQELAAEFQRRIETGDSDAAFPLRFLEKRNLGEIASLGKYFFNALEAAQSQLAISEGSSLSGATLALRSVRRYGLSWDTDLLRGSGVETLRSMLETVRTLEHGQLSYEAIATIAHIAPKLDVATVSSIVHEENEENERPRVESAFDPFAKLAMSSPRQLLLRNDPSSYQEVGLEETFATASVLFNMLVDKLSDETVHKNVHIGLLCRGAHESVRALGLLLPEVALLPEDTYEWLPKRIRALVDSVSWLVEVGGVEEDRSLLRYDEAKGLSERFTLSEELQDVRHSCWLLLSILLDPVLPWGNVYEHERQRLCRRAHNALQNPPIENTRPPGKIALETFLATMEPQGEHGVELSHQLRDYLLGVLDDFRVHRGSMPGYTESMAAALVAWRDVRTAENKESVYTREFRYASRLALRGRVFESRIQSFLFRAAE